MKTDASASPVDPGRPRTTGPIRRGRSPWERYGWLMAVVWLVFLIYPIIALTASTAPTGWRIVGWVALVTFGVVYVAGFIYGLGACGGGLLREPRLLQWVCFAALIACLLISIPAIGSSVLSYLPFVMAFSSYGLNRMAHWITNGGAVLVAAGVLMIVRDPLDHVAIMAVVVLLAVVNTVSTTLIIRSEQTERLGRELAVSEGRAAVARDVHDLVGHSLTVVRLKAQLARRLIDTDPERAKAEIADIETLTAEAIGDVRSTVADARRDTLSDQLATCRQALTAAGVQMQCEGEVGALSPVQALTAGWILREATTNVLRHAEAGTVTVRVGPGRFAVIDDGVGTGGREGNGLRGMRERAASAGATFDVASDPASGTRLEVTW